MLHPVFGLQPQIGQGTFLAPGCHVVGDVQLGPDCSVWFNTILRGDVGPIRIGKETNIQDGTVVHGTFNKAFARIGEKVTVGHSVILHGCNVDDLVLVGMGSILMDNSYVGPRNIIGAGSLITENADFSAEGWLIMGRPAKAIRPLKPAELAFLEKSANNYMMYKNWFQNPSTPRPDFMLTELLHKE